MAMSLNTSTLEGFVTQPPVYRQTKTGKNVCSFTLAVKHFSPGTTEQQVSFFDIETWEKLAELCSRTIDKGKRVMVLGAMRQDRWEGPDGKKHSRIKLVGREVRFLESAHREEAPALAEAV